MVILVLSPRLACSTFAGERHQLIERVGVRHIAVEGVIKHLPRFVAEEDAFLLAEVDFGKRAGLRRWKHRGWFQLRIR